MAHFLLRMNVWGVQVKLWNPWEHVPYLSASAVVIYYEEALYQVYGPLPLPFTFNTGVIVFYAKQQQLTTIAISKLYRPIN